MTVLFSDYVGFAGISFFVIPTKEASACAGKMTSGNGMMRPAME